MQVITTITPDSSTANRFYPRYFSPLPHIPSANKALYPVFFVALVRIFIIRNTSA